MMAVENINQIRTCRHMWNQAFLCRKYFLMMMTRHPSDVCTNLFIFSSLCCCFLMSKICAEEGKKSFEIRRFMLRYIFQTKVSSFLFSSHMLSQITIMIFLKLIKSFYLLTFLFIMNFKHQEKFLIFLQSFTKIFQMFM
jgi:hypothetical protein